jgi:hypothetical protein
LTSTLIFCLTSFPPAAASSGLREQRTIIVLNVQTVKKTNVSLCLDMRRLPFGLNQKSKLRNRRIAAMTSSFLHFDFCILILSYYPHLAQEHNQAVENFFPAQRLRREQCSAKQ